MLNQRCKTVNLVSMQKSVFLVNKMNCPSEEQLIRMKLNGFPGVMSLHFDLQERMVDVFHEGDIEAINKRMVELNLDTTLLATTMVTDNGIRITDRDENRVLIYVLLINFVLFIAELTAGLLANSMGLVARGACRIYQLSK